MRWILGLSFLAMAAWTLVPDKLEKKEDGLARLGVFGATLVSFFLVEMGDKTQIATVALAAHYGSFTWVLAGTTFGMLIANGPVVFLGERLLRRVPVRTVQPGRGGGVRRHGSGGAAMIWTGQRERGQRRDSRQG